MKRTQTELRDKTGNPIDRVSDAREMKLPIIIQQVNDDTAKKKKEAFAISQILNSNSGKKSRHAAKVFWASTIHMAVVLVFFRFYFSFVVQFLRFHSSDGAYAVFLSSFPLFFLSVGSYLHLYSGQSHFPCVWLVGYAIVQSWCEYEIKKESKRSRTHWRARRARASSLSQRIRNWRKMNLETLI